MLDGQEEVERASEWWRTAAWGSTATATSHKAPLMLKQRESRGSSWACTITSAVSGAARSELGGFAKLGRDH